MKIGVVGKYVHLTRLVQVAPRGARPRRPRATTCASTSSTSTPKQIERDGAEKLLASLDAILVPGGFGDRGTEGKIEAIRYARENKIPFFGICLGMQLAVVEFARNVCGLDGRELRRVRSRHAAPRHRPHARPARRPRARARRCASARTRARSSPGSIAAEAYGATEISERHRHRYEFANDYREPLEQAGLVLSGTSPDRRLVEMVELTEHPYFVGCQFHPEFKSRPTAPHPLFARFVRAAAERQQVRGAQSRKSTPDDAQPHDELDASRDVAMADMRSATKLAAAGESGSPAFVTIAAPRSTPGSDADAGPERRRGAAGIGERDSARRRPPPGWSGPRRRPFLRRRSRSAALRTRARRRGRARKPDVPERGRPAKLGRLECRRSIHDVNAVAALEDERATRTMRRSPRGPKAVAIGEVDVVRRDRTMTLEAADRLEWMTSIERGGRSGQRQDEADLKRDSRRVERPIASSLADGMRELEHGPNVSLDVPEHRARCRSARPLRRARNRRPAEARPASGMSLPT